MSDTKRPDHFCMDEAGNLVDEDLFTPADVRRIVNDAVERGELVFGVMQHEDNLMFKAFVPPTPELLRAMEHATTVLRAMLHPDKPPFPPSLRRRES